MASGVEEKLTKHLECAICLEKFKEPKVLSCQHTYCKRCLERLVTTDGRGNHKVICPECRRKTEVRNKEEIFVCYFGSALRGTLSRLMFCFFFQYGKELVFALALGRTTISCRGP